MKYRLVPRIIMLHFRSNRLMIAPIRLSRIAAACNGWATAVDNCNWHTACCSPINELNRYRCAAGAAEYLSGCARRRLLQDDYAKKLIAKPLPLNDSELMVLLPLCSSGRHWCWLSTLPASLHGGDKQLRNMARSSVSVLLYSAWKF